MLDNLVSTWLSSEDPAPQFRISTNQLILLKFFFEITGWSKSSLTENVKITKHGKPKSHRQDSNIKLSAVHEEQEAAD